MPSLRERLTTPSEKVSGRITIELTDDEMDDCRELAEARNASYADGSTTDTNFTDDGGEELHLRGLKAEYALSICYEEAELDCSISASGDGGVDCQIELDDALVDVDVKASSHRDSWIMVRENCPTVGEADVYVSAYVDGRTVELVGLADADDVLTEENLEPSPASWAEHENYTVREFDALPEPTGETERVTIQ